MENLYEIYLEVTEENCDDLNEMGFRCGAGDELTCNVYYDTYDADPSVGFNSSWIQINAILCQGLSVSSFFDTEKVYDDIYAHLSTLQEFGP